MVVRVGHVCARLLLHRAGATARLLLPGASALLLAACTDGVAAPDVSLSGASVDAETPTLQYVASSADAPQPATVRLRDSAGSPLARSRVTFTSSDGALEVTTGTLRTDSAGRVRLPRWIARGSGTHDVTVRAGSGASVSFRVVTLPSGIREGEDPVACPLLGRRLPHFQRLTRTAARLRSGAALTIVAFGSSSTFGTGLTSIDLAYPAQMQAQLRRTFPGSEITVLNAGVPGHSSDQLDARLESDVLVHAPDLVVLQTGTNDALKRLPFDAVRASTRNTIARLQALGIDVVVLDSQRFPGFGESELYQQYGSLVSVLAESMGVSTARRYEWMTAALETQRYGYGDLITADGLHQSALAHRCTARLLSMGITVAALERQPG